MRKRKVEREGDFIEVEIAQSVYAYCRLTEGASFAFYDFTSVAPIEDVSELSGKPFFARLWVMLYATRSWRWKIIESAPFTPDEYLLMMKPELESKGVDSPMTAEHLLRNHFLIKGYEELNENFPWQRVHDENYILK